LAKPPPGDCLFEQVESTMSAIVSGSAVPNDPGLQDRRQFHFGFG
jgi:hypothetical protein